VIGRGEAGVRLAVRLQRMDDARLAGLRGVAGPGLLLLVGPDLPWADGVAYLGRDPDAPLLLLPTHLRPDVPVDLLQRALVDAHGGEGAPLAVLVDPPSVVGVLAARAVDRSALERWLEGEAP